jgi:hypothetical protein
MFFNTDYAKYFNESPPAIDSAWLRIGLVYYTIRRYRRGRRGWRQALAASESMMVTLRVGVGLLGLLLQLLLPGSAQRMELATTRFSYSDLELCEPWAAQVPSASMDGMDHSGMDMGRRRAQASSGAQVRQYFIASEVVVWDYAPSGRDDVKGEEFPATPPAAADDGHAHDHSMGRRSLQVDHAMHGGGGAHAMHSAGAWMTHSSSAPQRIGRFYLKMRFVEYTDHTFTTRKPRQPEDEHLGILGPTLRAEVGDTIQVTFQNHAPDGFIFSMHPHGVKYAKQHEGAYYVDGTDMTGDHVMPGACAYYRWEVPESAGPAAGDSSTKAWLYHGHVSETADTNAGLVGAIIIGRAGATRSADRKPTDVDREFGERERANCTACVCRASQCAPTLLKSIDLR